MDYLMSSRFFTNPGMAEFVRTYMNPFLSLSIVINPFVLDNGVPASPGRFFRAWRRATGWLCDFSRFSKLLKSLFQKGRAIIVKAVHYKKVRTLLVVAIIFFPCTVKADFPDEAKMQSELLYSFFQFGETLDQSAVKNMPAQFFKFIGVNRISKNQSSVCVSGFPPVPPRNVSSIAGEQNCTGNCGEVVEQKCKKSFHDEFMIGMGYGSIALLVMMMAGRFHF